MSVQLEDPVAERIARGIQRLARHGRTRGEYLKLGVSAGKDRAEGPCCVLGSMFDVTVSGYIDRTKSGPALNAIAAAFRELHGNGTTVMSWHDEPSTTDEMVFDVLGAALAANSPS